MKRFFRAVGWWWKNNWDIFAMLGVLFAGCACVAWLLAYMTYFKDEWAREARNKAWKVRYEAECEAAKQATLAELREFVAGQTFDSLGKETRDMVGEALHRFHPDWRRPHEWITEVYPEVFEIVPGLREPTVGIKDAVAPPTVEEFQRRRAAFLEEYKTIYAVERTYSEITLDEYLRIDRRELFWLDTMGHRINDETVARAKDAALKVPCRRDAVFATRLVGLYGSGQQLFAMNSTREVGHQPFSDALLRTLVAGGHDYHVPPKGLGSGIVMPPEKPKDSVYSWSETYDQRIRETHLSFQGYSMNPGVLTDLTGRIVAIEVGKEAARVTFYDDGSPEKLEKLMPALIRLAELLGVKAREKSARWVRMDASTTWELTLGA